MKTRKSKIVEDMPMSAKKNKKTASTAASTIASVSSSKSQRKKASEKHHPLQRFPSSFFDVPVQRRSALDGSYVKHLFVKVRSLEQQEGATTTTLIVVNVSVDDTAQTLESFFSSLLPAFPISSVEIGKDRMALVFLCNAPAASAVESSLKQLTQEDCLALKAESSTTQEEPRPCCLDRWIAEYKQKRPDRAEMGRAADDRMAELDRLDREVDEEAATPQVDADGFTMVVSRRKKLVPPLAGKKKRPLVARPAEDGKKNKKGRIMDENLSFYKFERKRVRTQELSKLKDQFKNDRKRAARLRNEIAAHQSD